MKKIFSEFQITDCKFDVIKMSCDKDRVESYLGVFTHQRTGETLVSISIAFEKETIGGIGATSLLDKFSRAIFEDLTDA